jgi:hypothetical protein
MGGIRASIQEELLKSTPKTLYSALEAAQIYEKLEAEKKLKKVAVNVAVSLVFI